MRMTRLIILVWITLISMNNSTDVFADNSNQLRIGHSSISSLLNQKTITNVKLDKSGFLWIGTQQGLHKYDGNMVYTFSSRDRAKFWLSNLDIRQIYSEQMATDPMSVIVIQQKYEYDLMEYESELWEY